MAAPKRNRNKPSDPAFEKSRKRIQTTQLVKRLNNYALNQKDDQGNDVELDSNRVRAIQILLDKSLPSLTATTIDANVDNTHSFKNMSEEELDDALELAKNDLE